MSAKHTPGPWHCVGIWVEHEDDNVADICDCDPASMGQGHLGRTYDEMRANAKLIAAAPDMLEFLKYVRTLHEAADFGPIEIRRRALDNLIAKAEGRE